MSDATSLVLERFHRKRSARAEERAPRFDTARHAYQLAAAVLHRFSPDTLQPVGSGLAADPRLLLFEDIERASGEWSDLLFSLKNDIRRAALAELATREAMLAAVAANPERIMTPLQRMWEQYLKTGSLPELGTLGYHDLTRVCQILDWIEGIHRDVPRQADVLELIRRKSVLAGFEHLVASDFTGRVQELAVLDSYLGGVVPAGVQGIRQQLNRWRSVRRRNILVISGRGGVGKTALIARMLMNVAQAPDATRIRFAYLAFDQQSLRVETPFTLLVEAAAQFELQAPEHTAAIEGFRKDLLTLRDVHADLGSRRRGSSSRGARIGEVRTVDERLYRSFGRLLAKLGVRELEGERVGFPVLMVLDTFEEVQYRDQESLAGLWRMLAVIQEEYPPFRVIISGRSDVDTKPALQSKKMILDELNLADRVTLLGRLGVTDPGIANAVAQQVGGNPLSLHLAANVVTANPEEAAADGITNLTTTKWLLFQVDEKIIQGQLYRRILDHIHDENVRKLAHPGMVLRRITPEVILHVLAEVCLPALTHLPPGERLPEAKRLFDELTREYALVTLDADGALVYRADIRMAMVRLLEKDRYPEVRQLRRAAIEYYSGQDDVTSRAEEVYHRLALGEDELWTLDARWMKGIEQSIAASLDEYPDRVKAWLASRMNLEVPRSVFAGADLAEWERNTTRKVQRALSQLDVRRALALLGERKDRTAASPLFVLEAKAHLLREDLPKAAQALERGVESVAGSANRGRLAELFWLQSQVALLRDDPAAADRALGLAEDAIQGAANPVPLLHVLAQRLLLRKVHPSGYEQRTSDLRSRLNDAAARIDESSIYTAEFVVRLAAEMLENEYPRTRANLESFLGFEEAKISIAGGPGDPLTSENLQGLEEYREPWETATTSEDGPAPEALA